MEQRLDAMLRAVQTVQPALEKFTARSATSKKSASIGSARRKADATIWILAAGRQAHPRESRRADRRSLPGRL
jgi:ribosomal protein S7